VFPSWEDILFGDDMRRIRIRNKKTKRTQMISKGWSLIAVFSVILLNTAGCKVLREGQTSSKDVKSTTPLPLSTPDGNASDCSITIMGHGGVEVYITDPKSKNLGIALDSDTVVNEIPSADYQINPTWGEDAARGDATAQPQKLVIAHIPDPVEGLYRVQVHGKPDAQGGGLSVSARCNGKAEAIKMVSMSSDQKLPVKYQFTYSLQNRDLITEPEAVGR
jgi:hypothetical protein